MDSKQYIKNAIRTESVIDKAKVFDETVFVDTVRAFVASAALLDMFKKNIFYGKPINAVKWSDAATELMQTSKWISTNTPHVNNTASRMVDFDPRLLHAIVGIATESGELMEVIEKKLRLQQAIDGVNVQEEAFDAMWYLCILHDALDITMEDTYERGFAKLKSRYPEKFSSENAINRDTEAERAILEQPASK